MGSGKTTLGRRLAQRWGCTFLDLDREIETRHGRRIRQILQEDGEAAFRRIELQTLQETVRDSRGRCVVATGGGIVEMPQAAALLRRLGTIVWLRADPQVCVDRLGVSRAQRPLLDAGVAWRQRYEQRRRLYAALAQHIVDTGDRGEDHSLRDLLGALSSGGT